MNFVQCIEEINKYNRFNIVESKSEEQFFGNYYVLCKTNNDILIKISKDRGQYYAEFSLKTIWGYQWIPYEIIFNVMSINFSDLNRNDQQFCKLFFRIVTNNLETIENFDSYKQLIKIEMKKSRIHW